MKYRFIIRSISAMSRSEEIYKTRENGIKIRTTRKRGVSVFVV